MTIYSCSLIISIYLSVYQRVEQRDTGRNQSTFLSLPTHNKFFEVDHRFTHKNSSNKLLRAVLNENFCVLLAGKSL